MPPPSKGPKKDGMEGYFEIERPQGGAISAVRIENRLNWSSCIP